MKLKNPLNLDNSIHDLLWCAMYEETSLQEHSLERRAEHLFAQIAPNIALENLGSGVILLEDRENTHTHTHTYTLRIKKQ